MTRIVTYQISEEEYRKAIIDGAESLISEYVKSKYIISNADVEHSCGYYYLTFMRSERTGDK